MGNYQFIGIFLLLLPCVPGFNFYGYKLLQHRQKAKDLYRFFTVPDSCHFQKNNACPLYAFGCAFLKTSFSFSIVLCV